MCYFNSKAIAKLTASSIKKQLPSMHKTHTGLSDAQAEIEYLKVGLLFFSNWREVIGEGGGEGEERGKEYQDNEVDLFNSRTETT